LPAVRSKVRANGTAPGRSAAQVELSIKPRAAAQQVDLVAISPWKKLVERIGARRLDPRRKAVQLERPRKSIG